MDVLNFLSIANEISTPSGLWQWLILDVFDFIANYGLRVIIFTLLLKLLLSPLDIYQRVTMKKNQRITERIKPELDKLKKQYANDPAMLNRKQSELNRREGLKIGATCLPMLVTLAVSIYLLTGLSAISQYKNMLQYVNMYDTYEASRIEYLVGQDHYSATTDESGNILYDDEGNYVGYELDESAFATTTEKDEYSVEKSKEAISYAQDEVFDAYYDEYQESFLWVKNIWSPDVPWETPILTYSDFVTAVSKYGTDASKLGISTTTLNTIMAEATYNNVTLKLQEDSSNSTNGLLILPILSICVMIGSQILMRRTQEKSGQMQAAGMGGTGKMMMYMMPIMFGIFSLFYTAAFSLYISMSSTMAIVISLTSSFVLKMLDKKEAKKQIGEMGVIKYGRPDPTEYKKNKENNDTESK